MKKNNHRIHLLVGIILTSTLLGACTSGHMITIDSEPPGAEILANEKPIGKTPKKIVADDVFPPRWYGGSYMVKGKLGLEKEGCQKYQMDVNDTVLSKDIKATLNCSEVPSHSKPPVSAVPAKATVPQGVEQSLQQLKDLYDKGVITEQEYQSQRKRILDKI